MIKKLSRRALLQIAAALGVSAALGDALVTDAPWLDYDAQARRTWDTTFQAKPAATARMRELIRYAILAPSGHNAQPWKFAVSDSTIHIFPDYSRRLTIVDPEDRELWISLGCALENLIIAARRDGYEAEVTYPALHADFLTVHLRASSKASQTHLFEAISHRQNTRSLYDGLPVSVEEIKRMESIAAGDGVSLHLVTASDQKETMIEYVKAGDRSQYGDQAFVDELVAWIRFNKPEALHTLDGLYTRCSGSPQIPRWLGARFVTTASAARQSASDIEKIRSSSGLIVIASSQDDRHDWIETGRLYERLALTTTGLGIKTAFLNQPVEVAQQRSQLQNYLMLGSAKPQLILRYGYAPAMPRSMRRPVEQVLI